MKIGKNIINVLTSGLYPDSLFLYREYIQNAADQINILQKAGVADIDDSINIDINKDSREISFLDKATGIAVSDVDRLLGNIACSEKEGTDSIGFYGIGRLGALAYCSSIIFETSYAGESTKSTRIWDADKLREIKNDSSYQDDAVSAFKAVITAHQEQENPDSHYFKVTLKGILPNLDKLLDFETVKNYLLMTAPIEFDSTTFTLSGKIKEFVKDQGLPLREYKVFLCGNRLRKPYKRTIDPLQQKNVISEVKTEIFKNDRGDIIAWAWYGKRKELYSLSQTILPRRMRLRQHNIQIGSAETLSRLKIAEDRVVDYYVGEIHVVTDKFKPIASRDYFEISPEFVEFENQLTDFFNKLMKEVRLSSTNRSDNAKFIQLQEIADKMLVKAKSGYRDRSEKRDLEIKFAKKLEDSRLVVQKKRNKGEDTDSYFEYLSEKTKKKLNDYIDSRSTTLKPDKKDKEEKQVSPQSSTPNEEKAPEKPKKEKVPYITDNLTSYTKHERRLVASVLKILHKCFTKETQIYEGLQDKIIAGLNQAKNKNISSKR